jgi:hypothetical protein
MSPPRNPLVALQYVLPHRLLSRAACAHATRWHMAALEEFASSAASSAHFNTGDGAKRQSPIPSAYPQLQRLLHPRA